MTTNINIRNRNILFITSFLQGLIFYSPVSTLYLQSRGITVSQILIAEAVLMILMMVCDIPLGILADKFGNKNTLVLAFVLSFIAKIAYYFITGFPMLIVTRVFDAMAIAASSGSESSMVYSTAGKGNSEKIFGRYFALYSLGLLIAGLSSTVIVKVSLDFTVLLTVISSGMVVLLSLFLKSPVETEHRKQEAIANEKLSDSLKYLLKNKYVTIFVLSYAMMHGVLACTSMVLNQQQYARCGIDIRYFGILYAIIQFMSLFTDRTSVITGKIGQKNTLLIMYGVCVAGSFLNIFSVTVLSIPFLMAMCAIFFLVAPIVNDIQNKTLTVKNKVTVLSIYSTITSGTSIIISLSLGSIISVSLPLTFAVCGGILALSTVLYFVFYFYHEAETGSVSEVLKETA